MWVPTHVQVTVQRAVGLLTKGKNNTNDCFVTIGLGKVKYQTSVKEKAGHIVEWHEECELPIPDQGNTAEIALTALHHNGLGLDEFLGRVVIPLNSLDIYERPKNRMYTLESKPGGKKKDRGQLEVKIAFNVKSGSLTNLSKKEKHKSSLSTVAQSVGGSLLSLGSIEKRKGLKKFAKSIGSKMHLKGKKKDGDFDDGTSSIGSVGSLNLRTSTLNRQFKSRQTLEDADPGVVSDEDDFAFDDLSHKSSTSSISVNANTAPIVSPARAKTPTVQETPALSPVTTAAKSQTLPPTKPPRFDSPKVQDEWESKLFGNSKSRGLKPGSNESLNRRSWDSSRLASQIVEESHEPIEIIPVRKEDITIKTKTPEPAKKEEKENMLTKLKNFRKDKEKVEVVAETKTGKLSRNSSERVIIGGESHTIQSSSHISNELLQKFEGKSREDLILTLVDTQSELDKQKKKLKDLEDYLDDLLLRVMETTPRILQNPIWKESYVNQSKY